MYIVDVSPQAELDLERARRWWRKKRRDAPNMLDDEFEQVVGKLEGWPFRFPLVDVPGFEGARSILMPGTKRVVFYRVRDETTVIVLRVRGGQRKPLKKL